MDIKMLVDSFSRYWPLEPEATKALKECTIHQVLKRRELVLKPGEQCRHFNFVLHGCLKMYKVDDQGNRHNLQFAVENDWIVDYGSFYSEEPSDVYIETLEASTLLRIRNKDLFYLYDHFPVFDRNFRIIIENAFIEQQKRVLQNISSTAEERYLYFMKKYPHLFNRISNVQIASYIGVTPEFLSTIRKKLTSG